MGMSAKIAATRYMFRTTVMTRRIKEVKNVVAVQQTTLY
jgi:hypothetical protein